MNNDVKESFRKHLFKPEEIATLDHAGPKGLPYGTEHGIEWHTLMEDRAKAVLTKTSYELHEKGDAGISLLRKLRDEMNISIICGNFLLYGYMCNKKKITASNISLARKCWCSWRVLQPEKKMLWVCHRWL